MSPARSVRVVGIGASAGAVDAYSRLLAALPPDTGLAYVLVPHLSPNHHSELSQLLTRISAMPVTEAVHGEPLQLNDLLPEGAARLLSLNPVLVLVRGYRAVLLENRAPWSDGLLYLWVGSLAVAVLGYAWFHRLRKSFADVV